MSKILHVVDGNYKVKVANAGTITLDTGVETGKVVITGDLQINGDTTTVQSENLTVKDNIIILNDGETSQTGISLVRSGVQIDRGPGASYPAAQILFDENLTWFDPGTSGVSAGNVERSGQFVLKNINNSLVGLRTNNINTGGGDLVLVGSGNGVVKVDGTTNYEQNVTSDNDIPNKKYVDDAITVGVQTITIESIAKDNTSITVFDDSEDPESKFNVTIDGVSKADFFVDKINLEDIDIAGTTISTSNNNADLTLRTTGTGDLIMDGSLAIPFYGSVPSKYMNGTVLYTANPNYGDTGLYYVNNNSATDEMISTNRSLLYSMIF